MVAIFVVCCVDRCLWYVVCCLVAFVVGGSLFVVRVRCRLFVVGCSLCVVCWSVFACVFCVLLGCCLLFVCVVCCLCVV